MLLLIKYTLLYGIVLMLVALGGMFRRASWSSAAWRVC